MILQLKLVKLADRMCVGHPFVAGRHLSAAAFTTDKEKGQRPPNSAD